jgi:hypothetical protein
VANTTKVVKGEIKEMWGFKFSPALKYNTTTVQFGTIEDVKAAGVALDEKRIVKMVNQREVAKVRAEAIKNRLEAEGVKKPGLENDNEAIKAQANIFLKRGKASTQEEAEAMAREVLGLDDDNDDENDD